jgi:hypothetical protein
MTTKLRILFLASNPQDSAQLRLDEEIRAIHSKIRAAAFRDRFDLVSRGAVRPLDVLQAFNEVQPHLVHFSGHGSRHAELTLEDDTGDSQPVSAEVLSSLFENVKDNVRLVLLNACHSQAQASAISLQIECTVAMNVGIGDEAAIVFASHFYGALAFGRSVGKAFEQGRTALLLEGIPEQNTPSLLARPRVDPLQLSFVNRSPNPSFTEAKQQMPHLLVEMREDLRTESRRFVREFFAVSKRRTHGGAGKDRFAYWEEEHDNLHGKIGVLQDLGYVVAVLPGKAPIYRMTEEFVQLLLEE